MDIASVSKTATTISVAHSFHSERCITIFIASTAATTIILRAAIGALQSKASLYGRQLRLIAFCFRSLGSSISQCYAGEHDLSHYDSHNPPLLPTD
ncbi:uncharacterized protein ANIA_11654 [Aspergillus nidulans FGSC A4]|uniref:Uncharacterized protein n=1 Tax=Emericella nidulans (strain FGSC A4 / ATCC 38163 / CBS 112.46 / NRRL 194 / M139) TaxID=227321 RepID=C8VQC6_EMENI|nr:hypothetical protein [Aspergillus nidulans FGSC A4]CBF87314.1 TPA: hypothetical protein ANIA_11654 [Aspergillus nidulans FGSC A4]